MPNRMLKETICTSCEVDELSVHAERLLYRLITQVDDDGYIRLDLIRARCFPLVPILTHKLRQWLAELENVGLLEFVDDSTHIKLRHDDIYERPRKSLAQVRNYVLKRDNYTCVYCNSTIGPFHIDHVFPHSRGGSDEPDNLVCACALCNIKKGDKTLEEWGVTNAQAAERRN